jgi:hypothetical protein
MSDFTEERVMSNIPLADVLESMAARFDRELLALSADEIADEWHWSWDPDASVEWNTYQFSSILELHKRRWRRWEEHHHGSCCVVERVRDKYVMPRVREFLQALAAHERDSQPGS